MSMNESAVFTAATGYIYVGDAGTSAPTPAQIAAFNPDTFGTPSQTLVQTGGTAGQVTIGTTQLAATATAAQVQEALTAAYPGSDPVVTGTTLAGGPMTVYWTGTVPSPALATIAATTGANAHFGINVSAVADGGAWAPIGHTASEDLPEFGYEGGDTESKGSWQKKNLREVVTEAPVDYVTVKLLQFDSETLEYYYGKNASTTPGVFGVDGSTTSPVEKAILIVLVDGDFKIGFSAAKATMRRDESIELAADEFSMMPVRATFVKHPGRHLFEWISPIAATTATPAANTTATTTTTNTTTDTPAAAS